MRKSSVAILSLSLLLGTAAFALAAEAKQAADTKPAATADSSKTAETAKPAKKAATHKAATHKSVKGDVASVDDAGKSFVVHPKTGADVTVKVNDKTTYTLDGKKAAWSDVKAGLWASASYHVDGADNWAVKVALKNAPAKPAAK